MLCFKLLSTEMLFALKPQILCLAYVKIPEGLEEVLRLLRLI